MSCYGNDFCTPNAVADCPKCGNLVDEDGNTAEFDNCSYSEAECNLCGSSPCTEAC